MKTLVVAQSCDLNLHVILNAHLSLASQLLGRTLGGLAVLVKMLRQEECGAWRGGGGVSLQATDQKMHEMGFTKRQDLQAPGACDLCNRGHHPALQTAGYPAVAVLHWVCDSQILRCTESSPGRHLLSHWNQTLVQTVVVCTAHMIHLHHRCSVQSWYNAFALRELQHSAYCSCSLKAWQHPQPPAHRPPDRE